MKELVQERYRLNLQQHLDAKKSQSERNRLGQFGTPTALARDILQFGLSLLGEGHPIRFLDPAIGTGSFFSALIHTISSDRIEIAQGYELDIAYGESARDIWRGTPLNVIIDDFTRAEAPSEQSDRFNLLFVIRPMCVIIIFQAEINLVYSTLARLRAACVSRDLQVCTVIS